MPPEGVFATIERLSLPLIAAVGVILSALLYTWRPGLG